MKPIIYISRCLGFAPVRYNGEVIPDDFVEKLKPFVEFKTICPEMEIGMGVPRLPIHIEEKKDGTHLIQQETGKDFYPKMMKYTKEKVKSIGLTEAEGYIFKAKSPSCGIKDTKYYSEKGPPLGKRNGLFSDEVIKALPHLAFATEKQLSNLALRETFLTHIFTLASFRELKKHKRLKDLVRFHSENKYLMQAYNEKLMRKLGPIVANNQKLSIEEVFQNYQDILPKVFEKPCKPGPVINVLMHGFGFVSDRLTSKEKKEFLKLLELYRIKKIPLSTCQAVLRAHALRFEEKYLLEQRFFSPYPEELIDLSDSAN